MALTYLNFINGQDEPAASGKTWDHHNPADMREVVHTIAWGDETDARRAVDAARKAFDTGVWSGFTPLERSCILTKAGALVTARINELSAMLMKECGKPLPFCFGEVAGFQKYFDWYAAYAITRMDMASTSHVKGNTTLIIREPVGVAALIIPWNFPVMLLGQKLAPALAAGCTVVIKPTEFTAGTTIEIVKLFKEAGVPDGVINVVLGAGPVVGKELTLNKNVDFVSFTGSQATGRLVAANCASNMTKVALECGGKSPAIVFSDVDVDKLVANPFFLLALPTLHAGQVCATGSRLLVHESIKDRLVAKLVECFQSFAVGKPDDPTVLSKMPLCYSALQFPQQLAKVEQFVQTAQKEGATLLCGGHRIITEGLADGLFFEPTVFDNVTPSMTIAREEIFGPVLSVFTFKTIEEAIRVANDTTMGLAATIWSSDINSIMTCARGVRAGLVQVNSFSAPEPWQVFGGYKESGIGRENGAQGFEEFTETKCISIAS